MYNPRPASGDTAVKARDTALQSWSFGDREESDYPGKWGMLMDRNLCSQGMALFTCAPGQL